MRSFLHRAAFISSIGIIVLATAGAVRAADIYTKSGAVANSPASYGDPWAGLRVGGWVGYEKSHGDATVGGQSIGGIGNSYKLKKAQKALSGSPTGASTEMDGWGVGIGAEYLWRISNSKFLIGPGVSLGWLGDHGNTIVGGQQIVRSKKWEGDIYGKLEFVLPNNTVAPYGKLGYRMAKIETIVSGVASCGSGVSCAAGSDNANKGAGFWAVGVDALVAPQTLAFVEFGGAYYKDSTVPVSGTVSCGYKCTGTYSGVLTVPNREYGIRAGLNWSFGSF